MEFEEPAKEIRQLRRCINDLISVFALPAIWSGRAAPQIVGTLLDGLLGMLRLDFVYFRFNAQPSDGALEMVRVARSHRLPVAPEEIGAALDRCLGNSPRTWPALARDSIGGAEFSLVPLVLGLRDEIGVVVAGSARTDFPLQTERIVLNVAANQAVIGLQEARLLLEQKRVGEELDRRVAQRTEELAEANEGLRREIAERRLVEEKLRREEEQLRQSKAFLGEAQRLSSTGSFSWRVANDEIAWSDQLYRIFELDPSAEVTLELIRSRVHPEDLRSFQEMLHRARSEGGDFEYEHRVCMPDQSVRHLHMVAHGTRDAEHRLEYIGAVQDVTQRRRSEEALGKARSELTHMARVTSLGALSASIVHEVSQPLSGIITNASTCLRILAAERPELDGARETVRRTLRDGHRASQVISRLRALFSKSRTLNERVDLNEATREVIALSLAELRRHRVSLQTDLAADVPPVSGDRIQLQQVILNLLLNGADAMSGVDDRPRLLVVRTACDPGDGVRLTVQDEGVGIRAEEVERLFEAFYTTKSSGMGMGLSVSRAIIESHHGRIWAAPNEGPGASFSFFIPRGPDEEAAPLE
jgi:C4-dicarboxylate-specific signal transduction histidine kinase